MAPPWPLSLRLCFGRSTLWFEHWAVPLPEKDTCIGWIVQSLDVAAEKQAGGALCESTLGRRERSVPPITGKPWFGPRRFGWGWTPITWEGWVVSLVFLAAIVAAARLLTSTLRTVVIILLVVALLVASYLTGGAPGSTWGRRR